MSSGDELRRLADHFRSVKVEAVVSPVLSKAGAVMRDRARQEAPSGPHLRMKGGQSYADFIIFQRPSRMRVEVGAMESGLGGLSAILEYGQGANAPHPHIVPQLDREAEVTQGYLADAVVKAIRG